VYPLKTYEIPLGSRVSRGRAIVNLLSLSGEEKITTVLGIKEFDSNQFIVMATKEGLIKRCSLDLFSNIRKNGIIAISLDKNDQLIGAGLGGEKDEVILSTNKGFAIRFPLKEIRPTGRQSRGVRGVKLHKQDTVVSMVLLEVSLKKSDVYILTATEKGFAKRTIVEEYRLQSRGGKGIKNIKLSEKIGEVKKVCLVSEEDEIMCITQKGVLIRVKVKDIRETKRSTQGVKIINLDSGDKLSSISRIIPD
ncbi:MAG: DNA gyrase subunit A, partial [Candidatus Omnitrophica bacterium]|nr:DNA gyrase subunit A [Candidatus Omnitrophota bacterium]